MNLERIANWMELGVRPYDETMRLQNRLVELRRNNVIGDTILSVQHPLTVNFGASTNDNQFSEVLLSLVRQKYGDSSHENVMRYLSDDGVSFSMNDRGGGATVFAPGQFVFYPIVNNSIVTGSHPLDVAAYKNVIYKTLFDSLRNMGVSGINVGSQESYATRNERRDAWIERNGVTLKMGSKGFKIDRGVAHHGFALYVQGEGIAHNWMVNQCGYRPNEVKLWSVEQELGRQIHPQEVYGAVQKAIVDNFRYDALIHSQKPLEVEHAN